MDNWKVIKVQKFCNCSEGIAKELLTLAGGDTEIAIESSIESASILEAKARVLDKRFAKIERNESHVLQA